MSVRPTESDELNTRQRLFLLHGVQMSAEEALAMNESEFTYEFLKEKGIKATNITMAGIGPKRLKKMGLETAEQLRHLGFDALYMTDPKFASECNSCFGSDQVMETYLKSASDAVALSGSDAMNILGIQVIDLLNACAGAPTEASAVLQQLPLGSSLIGVPASVLLDTGLRKSALMDLGYSLAVVASQTKADANQLAKLGFGIN